MIKIDELLSGKYDEENVLKENLHKIVDGCKCFDHHSKETKDLLLEYISEHWDKVFVKSLGDEEMVLIIK
jgi:hypothetical protein